MSQLRVVAAAVAVGLVAFAPGARAGEESGPSAPASQAQAPPGSATSAVYANPSTAWRLHGGLGFGAADGKYGDVLQKPLQWDIGIAKQSASG
jgi:hypothetical protein